jgi:hypothetical protein
MRHCPPEPPVIPPQSESELQVSKVKTTKVKALIWWIFEKTYATILRLDLSITIVLFSIDVKK